MTTVKDLKAFLENFSDDTIVEVVCVDRDGFGRVVDLDLTAPEAPMFDQGNWDFTDFNGNQFVKEDNPSFGKKFLTLGEA